MHGSGRERLHAFVEGLYDFWRSYDRFMIRHTEVGDEDSYYEVEVTLPDGSQVDVQLDEDFAVVSADADSETDG